MAGVIKTKRSQIDFVMNLKKQGKTYNEISIAFSKKFGISKTKGAIEHLFNRYRNEYDLDSMKSVVEVKAEVMKERILHSFVEMVEKRKYIPIKAEFLRHSGVYPEAIVKYFESFEGLIVEAKFFDPEVFENIVDESLFNDENFEKLRESISEHQVFFVTSAVTNCEVHEPAMRAVETFLKARNAKLLVLPCSDPAKQTDNKNKWSLNPRIPKDSIVFKDVSLNNSLMLSTIKMSAKQLQPLTGLRRISQVRGSAIVASPKQFLEYAANSNRKEIPRGLASTGAITKAQYRSEMYMSERLSYLAELDHTLGGIIVEIIDDKYFHWRHVEIDPKTGDICDFDTMYKSNGKVEKIQAGLVQLPDWHVLSTDPVVRKAFHEIVELVKPEYMTLEDFFDGISINPHERKNFISKSQKVLKNFHLLDFELKACQQELNELAKWSAKKIVLKYGNHEDFLLRYLADGEFMNEPHNKILAMELNIAHEKDGWMPFEFAMRELYGLKNPDKFKFLGLNDSFKVKGIENGAHGHLGKSGHRNPGLAELEECYGAVNAAHNHSAGIWRRVRRVGTATYMELSYNNGSSTWTNTLLIQHQNGTRQLINVINGEFRLKD